MKKILIDAMMIKQKNTGLGIYACEVLARLIPKLSEKYDVTILCEDAALVKQKTKLTNTQYIEIQGGDGLGREFRVGKYVYKHGEYDLFYSLSQHGFPFLKMKEIITVHDIMPHLYPRGRLHQWIYYVFYLPFVIKSCERVLTVSKSTASDLKKYYFCNNAKVIYNGTSFADVQKSMVQNDTVCRKRYVTVGVHYPYKNLHSIIEIFINDPRFADRELTIIGNAENAYGQQLIQQVKKGNAEDRIKFTGYISDAEKQQYMSSAYAMIYPSKYEGFGLPVLEAMAQGLPVACSNTSSLPEVAGDAAVMFDPSNSTDMAEKILMLDEEATYKQMIGRGIENIKRFTWAACADTIMDVIDDVLK